MFLLNSLNLLLDGRRADEGRSSAGSSGNDFPEGQLTSAAWEGWWHEEAAWPVPARPGAKCWPG
ncbi:hypothetical protein FDW83_02090 [Pseudarthrobacter sp. NamE2]|uniref:hypothetical protein n=1 Tax=Pseudarthrobacter sp. NamE2 TaxID=2576838 RepID=UPI0010FD77F7|nr:hypothetical protein [Pseudarthrobacter sp. NamE2]TLM86556.1 hypothetical protein FDW83_02090 [Pseudarthrobacter sp. NamE2]